MGKGKGKSWSLGEEAGSQPRHKNFLCQCGHKKMGKCQISDGVWGQNPRLNDD